MDTDNGCWRFRIPWRNRNNRHAPQEIRRCSMGMWFLVNGYGVWGVTGWALPHNALRYAHSVGHIRYDGEEFA